MSLIIDPPELGFQRPFTREVSQVLRLQNPTSEAMAFKVKTTAPKQYCVRPNSGRIEPGKTVEVQVLLQALREDIPLDAKCRDKFLVQSVGISPDQDFANIASIWQNVEKTAKASISERKIRVSYLPPAEMSTPATRKSSSGSGLAPPDEPPAYGSPAASNFGSPGGDDYGTPARAVGPVSVPSNRPSDAKDLGEIRNSGTNPAMSSATGTVSAAAATVASAIPSNAEELKAQLAEAKAQIAKLTEQAGQGLRQRKAGGEGSDSGAASVATAIQQRAPSPTGVPVQIVAALCLLSFLLAYFFF